jgi:2-dehydro-3-deoxygluconokinase
MSPQKDVVAFGEVMMRLTPPGYSRIRQTRSFDLLYGGAEANVAISLAHFGVPVEFVTRLPANDVGDACMHFLRQYGLGLRHVVRGGERLGLYFLEMGVMQRPSKVIYDRANSALATTKPGMIDWRTIFGQADWFHWTGITSAVSAAAAATNEEAVTIAREMGLTISCDLNYRHSLWQWGKRPPQVMPPLVQQCDILIGNTAELMLGMAPVTADSAEAAAYQMCEQLVGTFSNLKIIVITLRDAISASHNTLSAVLWREGSFYTTPTYTLDAIVDRVGGGDAFMAGLIYGLRTLPEEIQRVLDFALAAAVLKHSIAGDANLVTVAEVMELVNGRSSGDVSR